MAYWLVPAQYKFVAYECPILCPLTKTLLLIIIIGLYCLTWPNHYTAGCYVNGNTLIRLTLIRCNITILCLTICSLHI